MGLLYLMGESAFNPRTLFANNEQGLWLDPSDFSTMWQDSGKTTPVTAAGDPVGYISDKSGRGNDAYQTTSASRPTLARIPMSGRRNLITYSEDLSNAAWNSLDVSGATRTNGNIKLNSNEGFGYHRQDGGSFSTTTDHVVTVDVTSDTTVANVPFRLAGTVDVISLVNLTAGQLTRLTFTGYRPFASSFRIGIDQRDALVPGGTNTTGYTVTFNRIQLETGSSATNYQKVVATTDVTESGVGDLWYLSFDGSDDSLLTNSVDFTGTDEMTVIAGVRKLSDGAVGMLAELGVGNANNRFYIAAPYPIGNNYSFNTKGTTDTEYTATTFTAPVTSVLSVGFDNSAATIAAAVIPRVNASTPSLSVAFAGPPGGGNYANAALFIGRRNQASLPYNGHIYQLIIRGKTTPTGKLLEAEKFVSKKTGVNL